MCENRLQNSIKKKSLMWTFTWFLNHSVAGVCYFLPFGLVWVLVVVEVAINSKGAAAQSQRFCQVARGDTEPILKLIRLNPCGNKTGYETCSSSPPPPETHTYIRPPARASRLTSP